MFAFLCFFYAVAFAAAAASMQIYEMCPGTSFHIPPTPEYDPKKSDLYFTPVLSGSGGAVMILKKTQPVDDHYKYWGETLFISELQERDAGIFSWSDTGELNTVLKLVIKDCSVPQVVAFGQLLALDIPSEAATLEFSPSSFPDTKEVLWPSTASKGYRHGDTWRIKSTSKADSGFYTFRKQSGVEVSKIKVIVTAYLRYYNIDEEEPGVFEIYFPISKYHVTLSITTPSGAKYTAVERGYVTAWGDDQFDYRMNIFSKGDGSVLSLSKLLRSDTGRYEFRDSKDNVIAVWILSTNPTPSYYVYLYAIIPVVLLILLCVCVKKCCCKKNKSRTPSAPRAVATDHTPYSPVEMNHLEPASTTVPQHPADTGRDVPTPSSPSAPSEPSAPQFQLRGFGSDVGDFLTSASGVDVGTANSDFFAYTSDTVYTSSKLN